MRPNFNRKMSHEKICNTSCLGNLDLPAGLCSMGCAWHGLPIIIYGVHNRAHINTVYGI